MERIYLYINRPAAIMVMLSVLLFGGIFGYPFDQAGEAAQRDRLLLAGSA